MATQRHVVSACSRDDMCYRLGTLSTLAGAHAATGQEFDLIAVVMTIGNGLTNIPGCDFLAAAHDGVIVRYAEQFSGYMKLGIQEGPYMELFTHPLSVFFSQPVAIALVYQSEGVQ